MFVFVCVCRFVRLDMFCGSCELFKGVRCDCWCICLYPSGFVVLCDYVFMRVFVCVGVCLSFRAFVCIWSCAFASL